MKNIKLNSSKDKIIQVFCANCTNNTRHKVISSVETNGKEDMGDGDFYFWNSDYQIIECQGCETVSFRSESSNSEDYDYIDNAGNIEPIITEMLYPKRTQNTLAIKLFYNIPPSLKRIYRETIDCFNNESFTLCGAGVRALVEGLCLENGVVDGEIERTSKEGLIKKYRSDNLQGKINGLYEKGRLTKENAEILHEHRFLGNTAIHDLAIPSKEELSLAIEILEHVFDNLYEIPRKAVQLKNKRLQK